MKIAIFGKKFEKHFNEYIYKVFKKLNFFDVEIFVYSPFYDWLVDVVKFKPQVSGFFESYTELNKSFDFVISIGGDGTFLETITFVRNSGIPIIGINSGRLGFLANISKDEISHSLGMIFDGLYEFEERSLIKISSKEELFGDFNYALNEVTIHKHDSSSMIKIHVYLNNEFLNSYWGDGLIISTPTGSTAYSLSVGGPIVVPDSSTFIITPIAPHHLTVRPLVISDKAELKLKIEGRSLTYMASLDQRSCSVDLETEILIKKSEFNIRMIKFKDQSFFTTLRNKLMWGFDKRDV